MLLAILWPVSIVVALLVGVSYRYLLDRIKSLENLMVAMDTHLKLKGEIPKKLEESKAVIVDPTDIGQQVKMQQAEMMRQLNPEMYDEDEDMQ